MEKQEATVVTFTAHVTTFEEQLVYQSSSKHALLDSDLMIQAVLFHSLQTVILKIILNKRSSVTTYFYIHQNY